MIILNNPFSLPQIRKEFEEELVRCCEEAKSRRPYELMPELLEEEEDELSKLKYEFYDNPNRFPEIINPDDKPKEVDFICRMVAYLRIAMVWPRISPYLLLRFKANRDIYESLSDVTSSIRISSDECYDCLQKLVPSYAKLILTSNPYVSVDIIQKLVIAWENHDKEQFLSFLKNETYNWDYLYTICSYFQFANNRDSVLLNLVGNLNFEDAEVEEDYESPNVVNELLRYTKKGIHLIDKNKDEIESVISLLRSEYRLILFKVRSCESDISGLNLSEFRKLLSVPALEDWYIEDEQELSEQEKPFQQDKFFWELRYNMEENESIENANTISAEKPIHNTQDGFLTEDFLESCNYDSHNLIPENKYNRITKGTLEALIGLVEVACNTKCIEEDDLSKYRFARVMSHRYLKNRYDGDSFVKPHWTGSVEALLALMQVLEGNKKFNYIEDLFELNQATKEELGRIKERQLSAKARKYSPIKEYIERYYLKKQVTQAVANSI